MVEESLIRTNEKLDLLNSMTRHDLNNQLLVIEGNIELIERHGNDAQVSLGFARVHRSLKNIKEQLSFAKEYQELGTVAPTWQSIHAILQDPTGHEDLERLEVSDRARHLGVYTDPMLDKVFYNLMENSVRYGGKVVSVKIDCHENGQGLIVTYEDDGQGIPTYEKEMIFEKGYGKGTGLGLFLSRET